MVLDLELRPIARDFNLALRAWRARRRAQSAPAAMARALGPVDVALGVKFRLGTQAEAAWGSSTSVVQRAGRSLSLFHFTVPTATLTSSGVSLGNSKRRVARMDSDHLCRECGGTGRCSIARRPKMAILRKPTVCVPRVTRHATVWDQAVLTFAPFLRPGAWGKATTARSPS
jgi:hypothetical protein